MTTGEATPMVENVTIGEKPTLAARIRKSAATACEIASLVAVCVGYVVLMADGLANMPEGGEGYEQ